MASIAAQVVAARASGATWKELVIRFGLCRSRLHQLFVIGRIPQKSKTFSSKRLTGLRNKKKCL